MCVCVCVFVVQAAHFALADINPLSKFAAIKFIVFAAWWQEVTLTLLEQFNLLPWKQEWCARPRHSPLPP